MLRIISIFLVFMVAVSMVNASSRASINLSDKDLEAGFDYDMGQFVESYAKDTYFAGVHYLSTNDNMGYSMLRLHFFLESNFANSENVRIAVGIKAVWTQLLGKTFLAAPIGAVVEYHFPQNSRLFFTNAELFYAPAPFSINPAESYFEARTGLGLEPMQKMRGFLEWRILFTNFAQVSVPTLFNNTIALGVRIGF